MLTIFKAIILTSLAGSAFALVITVLKPITQRFFSSSWHYKMWIAVLFVMMCPLVISLPERVTEKEIVFNIPVSEATVKNTATEEIVINEAVSHKREIPLVNFNFIAAIWFSFAVLLIFSKLVKYAFFLIKMRKNSVLEDSFDKRITVRKSSEFSSPVLIGIFKPVLLLPESEIAEEQMKNVIMHEMTHFKRKDVLVKWFSVITKCVHWFNPIIYFVCCELEKECEISCDEAVTKNMEYSERKSYADTILMLISSGNKASVMFSAGMTKMLNIKIMKRRFEMIKNSKSTNRKVHIFSGIIAMVLIFSMLLISGIAAGELLKPTDWAENEVKLAQTYGLIPESLNITDFKKGITREQFSELAYKLCEKTGRTYTNKDGVAIKITLEPPLSDTDNEKCEFMLYSRIMQTVNENEFAPDKIITREEAAYFLKRIYEFEGPGKNYKDIDYGEVYPVISDAENISEDKKESVYNMYTASILKGMGSGSFMPKENFTLEQAIASMVRIYEKNINTVTTLSFMMPANGTVTSEFGTRVHPILKTELSHDGIDIGAKEGDNVVASEKGTVSETGFDTEWGNYITVNHSAAFSTKYTNLSEILVNIGDNVTKGQMIGKVGKTGKSTGPHLHFELHKNGVPVNPMEYME